MNFKTRLNKINITLDEDILRRRDELYVTEVMIEVLAVFIVLHKFVEQQLTVNGIVSIVLATHLDEHPMLYEATPSTIVFMLFNAKFIKSNLINNQISSLHSKFDQRCS